MSAVPPGATAFRRAGPEDVPAIAALTQAAYAPWVAVIGRAPKPMTADHARAVREHVVDLACDGAAIVALVEMIDRPDDVLVESLAVHPDHQGRGLGARLLDHASQRAQARGTPTLRLYTNARFLANLAFYARRGFGVEREETNERGIIVHFVKRLEVARV